MDFRELNYIIAIAEEGTISRAADKLFISQPTLSRFLQNHENQIGTPLFKRSKGQMLPTYAGERYLYYARQITHMSSQMNLELNEIALEQSGQLRIAAPRHRLDGIIALSVLRFKNQFPHVETTLLELNTEKRIQALDDGIADIAIIYPSALNPSLVYEPILQEEIVLCVPPDHPLTCCSQAAAPSGITPDIFRNFSGESFILMPKSTISGRVARHMFRLSGFRPNVVMETSDLSGCTEAVQAGYGCAFIPDSFLRFSSASSLKRLPLDTPKAKISLTVAFDPNAYQPKYMRHFIQILKETIASKYQS